MSLFTASLNSGSNGNCYYVGNAEEAVLIDAGISCREVERRMTRLGLTMRSIKAIFISHEHSDHINGVHKLSARYRLPVYVTPRTCQEGRLTLSEECVQTFQAFTPITIGNLSITAFPKLHDACDPHSFIVRCGEVTVGVFTDLGLPCEHLIHYFQQCHAAFLEANYDEEMLERGRYPFFLKNRIRGGLGHLSNTQALKLFTEYRPPFMSHLFLSHLSKDNNRPELVHDLFRREAGATEIVVASRYVETPVYHITSTGTHAATLAGVPRQAGSNYTVNNLPVAARIPPPPIKPNQLSLF